jgi:hypothetical protein
MCVPTGQGAERQVCVTVASAILAPRHACAAANIRLWSAIPITNAHSSKIVSSLANIAIRAKGKLLNAIEIRAHVGKGSGRWQ